MHLSAAITGDLKELLQKQQDELADAARSAVEETSLSLQSKLRAQVRSAGLGQGLEKAWQRTVFPRSARKSAGPAALVFSRATKLHAAYNQGGIIRTRNAQWLVIPLPAATENGFATSTRAQLRGAKKTHYSNIEAAERKFGKLHPIPLKRGAILLVADVRARAADGQTKFRRVASHGNAKSNASIPLFILVRQVRIKKVLDIEGPSNDALTQLYTNLSNVLGRNAS